MNISRTLINVDGSDNSLGAVEFGSDVASRRGASMTLFMVIAPSEAALFNGKDARLPEDEGIHQIGLRKTMSMARGREGRGTSGARPSGEDHFEGDQGLRLVMGSGISRIRGFLMGSVTKREAHHRKVPVVMVP